MKTTPIRTSRSEGLPRVRVANELRRWLQEGKFSAGEMLPTEQVLCERLKVSRGTVRTALQQLENEGLVQGQKGRGRMRGRIITQGATPRNSLMIKTIVLLTHLPTDPEPNMQGGGLEVTDSGAVDAIHAASKHLFVLHTDALNDADMSRLLADPPVGVIVGPAVADYAPNREVLLKLAGKVPMVVGGSDDMWAGVDRVISDHAAGASDLTNWLINQGCKKILRVWGGRADSYWVRERNRGFETTMHNAGLTPMPPVIVRGMMNSTQYGLTREMFEIKTRQLASYLIEHLNGPRTIDAIMGASDAEVACIAAACRLFGVEPHKDIKIVGYDNYWTESPESKYEPAVPAATVDKLNHWIGEVMVQLLLDRVDGKLPPEPQCKVLPPKMLIHSEAALNPSSAA